MKLLLTLLVALIIILLAENSIRKHAAIWYCAAFVLSLICLQLPSSAPTWLTSFATNIIGRGTLATAIFILVMYARVFPPKSRLFRTLMSLRAPLAIMASFMILLHNGTYFIHYYKNIHQRHVAMTFPEIIAAVCTVLMLLLLIPLTITSFNTVRKKMKGITWKKLQRFSYLFYGLIYLHVACLFGAQIARGNKSYQLELAIYTAIFGIYLISRVALYLKNKKKLTAEKLLRRIGIPAVLALSVCLIVLRLPQKANTDNQMVVIEESSIALADTVSETLAEPETFAPTYQDGEWVGTALGYNDDITVSVTIADGIITNISIIESFDDEPYFDWAKEEIPQSIITSQSTNVDTVSGATFSSEGIIDAVNAALEKAQK